MKSFLVTISLVLLYYNVSSQSGWQIQIGGSAQYQTYYSDLFFLGGGTGWILFQKGIKHTTNNGDIWIDYFFNDTSVTSAGRIFFIDPSNGWMLGNRLYKTSNSGQNWTPISTVTGINKFYFINSLSGWSCGPSGVLKKSIDGGQSWIDVVTGISENFNDVYFINAQTGIVAADWGKILRTNNGGINWSVFYDNITYSFMQTVKFVDNNTGFVSGSGGYIFKTVNAGENWTILNTGSYNILRDMAFINSQTGYACGLNGGVYRTTNGGSYWSQTVSGGLYANVLNIEVTASGRLWICTDSACVYRSDDNAASWSEIYRQFITSRLLYSIRFFNQNTGCACGELGTIIRTTNGGDNWVNINIGNVNTLRCLYVIDQLTGFAAGGTTNRNVIFKTTNAGMNWFSVSSDSTSFITSMFFLNPQTGWTCGFGTSNILKTTNSGMNWYKVNTAINLFQLRDIEFINNNTGFVVNNSACYLTTNGGTNWSLIPNTTAGYSIHFFNSNTGYYLGLAGNSVLNKTTDGGNNWAFSVIGPSGMISMFFVNQNKGWVCGNYGSGKIKLTTNSGLNWSQQSVDIGTNLYSIYFINESEGWACGDYGTIVHTTTGGIGINKISNEIPNDFNLYQNYPNPFNPLTKVKFEIPAVEMNRRVVSTRLTIYDILGREISTLVNENLYPGVYEVEFDGTRYSSGVYFYRLSAMEFVMSRKMILLK